MLRRQKWRLTLITPVKSLGLDRMRNLGAPCWHSKGSPSLLSRSEQHCSKHAGRRESLSQATAHCCHSTPCRMKQCRCLQSDTRSLHSARLQHARTKRCTSFVQNHEKIKAFRHLNYWRCIQIQKDFLLGLDNTSQRRPKLR